MADTIPKPDGQRLRKKAKPSSTDEAAATGVPSPEAPHSTSVAAQAYQPIAPMIYSLVRHFLPEPAATEAVRAICRSLSGAVAESGYNRYAHLLCLRETYLNLAAQDKEKLRTDLKPVGLSIEDTLCLLLRDRHGLSCADIAAVVGTSEGSIRTRLQGARRRGFGAAPEPGGSPVAKPPAGHACIHALEKFEEWIPKDASDDAVEAPRLPAAMMETAGGCERCLAALTQRMLSATALKRLPSYTLPEELRTFPVSAMVAREGKRLIFNWGAAPWYVKAFVEGLIATTVVVAVVLLVPRAKKLYEFWLERRFDLYSVAELAVGLGKSDPVAQPVEAQPQDESEAAPVSTTALVPTDTLMVKVKSEFVGKSGEILSPDRVARVMIKIDEPQAIKAQVLQILNLVPYVIADGEAQAGSDLPGGILFDVFVPEKQYKALVNELGKLGDTQVLIARAKQKGMAGKARLKIWLQRI